MQTADFDVNDFSPENARAGDEKLLVKFFIKPRQDAKATADAGHPVFKDVEYIDIKIPGSRTGGACRPASHADKQRFPKHYAAFKQRVEEPVEGTPLMEWPMITRSQAEELAFHNVKTVEQLVGMSDGHAMNFMGINALKAKAKKWLEVADEAAAANAIAERDDKIATLEAQVEKLMAALETQGTKTETTKEPAQTAIEPSELDEPAPKPRRKRRAKKAVTGDGTV